MVASTLFSKIATLEDSVEPRVKMNVNIFVVFGSVKDGSFYYSNSFFVPSDYNIDTSNISLPGGSASSINNYGNYYRIATTDNSLAGKGTNFVANFVHR